MEDLYIDNKLILTTRKMAIEEYKNSCVKYVNDCIHAANSHQCNHTEIYRNSIYPELEEHSRKTYDVLVDVHNMERLIISWE